MNRSTIIFMIFLAPLLLLTGCEGEADGTQIRDDVKRLGEGESPEIQQALGYFPDPNAMVNGKDCDNCSQVELMGLSRGRSGSFGKLGVNVRQGCGYKFTKPPLTRKDLEETCKAVNSVLAHGHAKNACFPSNCSTATWLALAKRLRNNRKMREKMACRPPRSFGANYSTFIGYYGLKKFIERNGIGQYKQISSKAELRKMAAQGWPKKGDFIQLDRRIGRSFFGHAAQFSHYQMSGSTMKICYWSSNKSTKGFGTKCEPITDGFRTLGVGRISG